MRKIYWLIVLLFLSIGVAAQNQTQFFRDSANVAYLKTPDANSTILYVVDGIPVSNKVIKIDDILIKKGVTGDVFGGIGEKKLDSIFIIITKRSAISGYQTMLSRFSGKYRRYLKIHKNNDRRVLYVVNGAPLGGVEKEIIKDLYEIRRQDVVDVRFIRHASKKGVYDYTSDNAALIIETKQ